MKESACALECRTIVTWDTTELRVLHADACAARPVAALFVATRGPYFGVPGVEPWDEARDARSYAGSKRVVAHPPCKRWGRYATGGPNPAARRFEVGDDGGCFESALAAVRRCGGVIEHPAGSKAWPRYGLPVPPREGWSEPDAYGGRSCHVEQGHYGHPARKATWLYAKVPHYPEFEWGRAPAQKRIEMSPHSKEEARAMRSAPGYVPHKRLSQKELVFTPEPFRDMLLRLARGWPADG